MKRIATIIMSLIPLIAVGQKQEIIGGILDSSLITETAGKEKKLGGKGVKIPGAVISLSNESIGKEIGSVIEIKKDFLLKKICFTVTKNQIDGCKARIQIYSFNKEENSTDIVTIPIYQEIPKTDEQCTFNISPEKMIKLTPGLYYISFCIVATDTDKGNKLLFPLYSKESYTRRNSAFPLERRNVNIGIYISGEYLK